MSKNIFCVIGETAAINKIVFQPKFMKAYQAQKTSPNIAVYAQKAILKAAKRKGIVPRNGKFTVDVYSDEFRHYFKGFHTFDWNDVDSFVK